MSAKKTPSGNRTRKKAEQDLFATEGAAKGAAEEKPAQKPTRYKNTMMFEYLGNIVKEKSIDKYNYHVEDVEFVTSFNGYVILRYLSMHPVPAVRNVVLQNQMALERMTPRAMYRFLLDYVPRQFSSYIKYLKPLKDTTNEEL
jgi:hypothetical protein